MKRPLSGLWRRAGHLGTFLCLHRHINMTTDRSVYRRRENTSAELLALERSFNDHYCLCYRGGRVALSPAANGGASAG